MIYKNISRCRIPFQGKRGGCIAHPGETFESVVDMPAHVQKGMIEAVVAEKPKKEKEKEPEQ